jgi:hypothetical protein
MIYLVDQLAPYCLAQLTPHPDWAVTTAPVFSTTLDLDLK